MHFPVLVLFASALLAQSSGTITGTLTDVYGGVLGKAAIQATNVATKALYKAESSPTGAYTLAQLPAGTYDMSASVPGLVPFEQKNIAGRAGQTPAYLVVVAAHGGPPRQIVLGGRSQPKDLDPTWRGPSIGDWEGDTLVVDSVGFNGRAWIDLEGHPFTEKTHITERWRRPDLGHLEVEFTIDDPSSYVKPWTIKRISDLAPKGEEVAEYVCTENNKDVPHLVGK